MSQYFKRECQCFRSFNSSGRGRGGWVCTPQPPPSYCASSSMPGITLINLSAAGATAADAVDRQIGKLRGTWAALVTVCVDVNDLLRGREAGRRWELREARHEAEADRQAGSSWRTSPTSLPLTGRTSTVRVAEPGEYAGSYIPAIQPLSSAAVISALPYFESGCKLVYRAPHEAAVRPNYFNRDLKVPRAEFAAR